MYSGIRRNHKNFRRILRILPGTGNAEKICKAKLELNEIINKKTKFLAQRLRWQEFEYGNKSGQFLANQLKINKEKTTICAVKDLTGDTVYDPERINNTFRDFTNLYILHR